MTRKERTEILARSDIKTLKKMASVIEKTYSIEKIEDSNSGLVMVKMRESAQKYLFYLGEVFVTECKVLINGVMGLGIIRGAHLKKAYYMAVIDAAYNAQVKEVIKLNDMLLTAKEKIDEQKSLEVSHILKTKVDFETLDEEVKA